MGTEQGGDEEAEKAGREEEEEEEDRPLPFSTDPPPQPLAYEHEGAGARWLRRQEPQSLLARCLPVGAVGAWTEYVDPFTRAVFLCHSARYDLRWSLAPMEAHPDMMAQYRVSGARSVLPAAHCRSADSPPSPPSPPLAPDHAVARLEAERVRASTAPEFDNVWWQQVNKMALVQRSALVDEGGGWRRLRDPESSQEFFVRLDSMPPELHRATALLPGGRPGVDVPRANRPRRRPLAAAVPLAARRRHPMEAAAAEAQREGVGSAQGGAELQCRRGPPRAYTRTLQARAARERKCMAAEERQMREVLAEWAEEAAFQRNIAPLSAAVRALCAEVEAASFPYAGRMAHVRTLRAEAAGGEEDGVRVAAQRIIEGQRTAHEAHLEEERRKRTEALVQAEAERMRQERRERRRQRRAEEARAREEAARMQEEGEEGRVEEEEKASEKEEEAEAVGSAFVVAQRQKGAAEIVEALHETAEPEQAARAAAEEAEAGRHGGLRAHDGGDAEEGAVEHGGSARSSEPPPAEAGVGAAPGAGTAPAPDGEEGASSEVSPSEASVPSAAPPPPPPPPEDRPSPGPAPKSVRKAQERRHRQQRRRSMAALAASEAVIARERATRGSTLEGSGDESDSDGADDVAEEAFVTAAHWTGEDQEAGAGPDATDL